MGAVGRFTLAHMTQPGWKYNNTLECFTLALDWHVCGFLIVDQGMKILNPTRSLTLFHLEGEGCLVTASLGKILSLLLTSLTLPHLEFGASFYGLAQMEIRVTLSPFLKTLFPHFS